jgi:Cd2+/Zn2+-exporting ATPase
MTLQRGAAVESTEAEFCLSGLDCADCAARVQQRVARLPGVLHAQADFVSARLMVRFVAPASLDQIRRAVEQSGYQATPLDRRDGERTGRVLRPLPGARVSGRVLRLAAGAVALVAGGLLALADAPELWTRACFALAIALPGYRIALSGLSNLLSTRTADMNLLMSIAVVGAAVLGEWAEAATVVVLFALGNALESYSADRARRAIRRLMELAPARARVLRDGHEVEVPAREVQVGELVAVRPGERVPIDGEVVEGRSSVNQAPITGESVPVPREPGDTVFAGSINGRGYLLVRTTRPYAEMMIARILHLVEAAQQTRAPLQRHVDRFAAIYTPAVMAGAAVLATVPWAVLGQPLQPWLYRALVFLVIACPCALVISTPVAIAAGLARAAREGILIKGGAYLELAGRIKALAFDKTGTLTEGQPEVVHVEPLGSLSEQQVLELAAAIEARSEHPLAAAVLRRAAAHAVGQITLPVQEFEALAGRGVQARINGHRYVLGSPALLAARGIDLSAVAGRLAEAEQHGQTVLALADEQGLLALFIVETRIRPGAAAAVARLHELGIAHTVMLTGDNAGAAAAVNCRIGVAEVRAGLLPEDKLRAVRELQRHYGLVAMVGDGVNDAPALAAADIGIAMGAAGTDVALETADIALMSDDLMKVPEAIALSRRTLGIVRQNIAISLLTKGVFLALGAAGLAGLWLAVLADMGTSLLVTLNSMRLLAGSTLVPGRPAPAAGGRVMDGQALRTLSSASERTAPEGNL